MNRIPSSARAGFFRKKGWLPKIAFSLSLVFIADVSFGFKPSLTIWETRQQALTETGPSAATPSESGFSPELKSLPLRSDWPASLPSSLLSHVNIKAADLNGKGSPVLILEDVHLHQEAQSRIYESLNALGQTHGESPVLVGLEGASGEFYYPAFQHPLVSRQASLAADTFFKEGLISGPAKAGYGLSFPSGARGLRFWGVEDAGLYKKNVEAVRRSNPLAPVIKKELDASLEKNLSFLQNSGSDETARLASLALQFDKESVSLETYLLTLSNAGDLSNFTEIQKFLAAVETEKALDFSSVEAERKTILSQLAKNLNQADLDLLLGMTVASKEERITRGEYFSTLQTLSSKAGVDLARAPHFRDYLQYVLLVDAVDPAALWGEAREAEKSIFISMARSDREAEVIREFLSNRLARKLAGFSLTPAEWADWKQTTSFHEKSKFSTFESFYEAAEERNAALVSRLLSRRNGEAPSVLVAGGFHTEGLAPLLKERNIPYVVASPKLTQVDAKDGASYLSIFDREKTPLEELFQGQKLFLSPERAGAVSPILGGGDIHFQLVGSVFALAARDKEASFPELKNWIQDAGWPERFEVTERPGYDAKIFESVPNQAGKRLIIVVTRLERSAEKPREKGWTLLGKRLFQDPEREEGSYWVALFTEDAPRSSERRFSSAFNWKKWFGLGLFSSALTLTPFSDLFAAAAMEKNPVFPGEEWKVLGGVSFQGINLWAASAVLLIGFVGFQLWRAYQRRKRLAPFQSDFDSRPFFSGPFNRVFGVNGAPHDWVEDPWVVKAGISQITDEVNRLKKLREGNIEALGFIGFGPGGISLEKGDGSLFQNDLPLADFTEDAFEKTHWYISLPWLSGKENRMDLVWNLIDELEESGREPADYISFVGEPGQAPHPRLINEFNISPLNLGRKRAAGHEPFSLFTFPRLLSIEFLDPGTLKSVLDITANEVKFSMIPDDWVVAADEVHQRMTSGNYASLGLVLPSFMPQGMKIWAKEVSGSFASFLPERLTVEPPGLLKRIEHPDQDQPKILLLIQPAGYRHENAALARAARRAGHTVIVLPVETENQDAAGFIVQYNWLKFLSYLSAMEANAAKRTTRRAFFDWLFLFAALGFGAAALGHPGGVLAGIPFVAAVTTGKKEEEEKSDGYLSLRADRTLREKVIQTAKLIVGLVNIQKTPATLLEKQFLQRLHVFSVYNNDASFNDVSVLEAPLYGTKKKNLLFQVETWDNADTESLDTTFSLIREDGSVHDIASLKIKNTGSFDALTVRLNPYVKGEIEKDFHDRLVKTVAETISVRLAGLVDGKDLDEFRKKNELKTASPQGLNPFTFLPLIAALVAAGFGSMGESGAVLAMAPLIAMAFGQDDEGEKEKEEEGKGPVPATPEEGVLSIPLMVKGNIFDQFINDTFPAPYKDEEFRNPLAERLTVNSDGPGHGKTYLFRQIENTEDTLAYEIYAITAPQGPVLGTFRMKKLKQYSVHVQFAWDLGFKTHKEVVQSLERFLLWNLKPYIQANSFDRFWQARELGEVKEPGLSHKRKWEIWLEDPNLGTILFLIGTAAAFSFLGVEGGAMALIPFALAFRLDDSDQESEDKQDKTEKPAKEEFSPIIDGTQKKKAFETYINDLYAPPYGETEMIHEKKGYVLTVQDSPLRGKNFNVTFKLAEDGTDLRLNVYPQSTPNVLILRVHLRVTRLGRMAVEFDWLTHTLNADQVIALEKALIRPMKKVLLKREFEKYWESRNLGVYSDLSGTPPGYLDHLEDLWRFGLKVLIAAVFVSSLVIAGWLFVPVETTQVVLMAASPGVILLLDKEFRSSLSALWKRLKGEDLPEEKVVSQAQAVFFENLLSHGVPLGKGKRGYGIELENLKTGETKVFELRWDKRKNRVEILDDEYSHGPLAGVVELKKEENKSLSLQMRMSWSHTQYEYSLIKAVFAGLRGVASFPGEGVKIALPLTLPFLREITEESKYSWEKSPENYQKMQVLFRELVSKNLRFEAPTRQMFGKLSEEERKQFTATTHTMKDGEANLLQFGFATLNPPTDIDGNYPKKGHPHVDGFYEKDVDPSELRFNPRSYEHSGVILPWGTISLSEDGKNLLISLDGNNQVHFVGTKGAGDLAPRYQAFVDRLLEYLITEVLVKENIVDLVQGATPEELQGTDSSPPSSPVQKRSEANRLALTFLFALLAAPYIYFLYSPNSFLYLLGLSPFAFYLSLFGYQYLTLTRAARQRLSDPTRQKTRGEVHPLIELYPSFADLKTRLAEEEKDLGFDPAQVDIPALVYQGSVYVNRSLLQYLSTAQQLSVLREEVFHQIYQDRHGLLNLEERSFWSRVWEEAVVNIVYPVIFAFKTDLRLERLRETAIPDNFSSVKAIQIPVKKDLEESEMAEFFESLGDVKWSRKAFWALKNRLVSAVKAGRLKSFHRSKGLMNRQAILPFHDPKTKKPLGYVRVRIEPPTQISPRQINLIARFEPDYDPAPLLSQIEEQILTWEGVGPVRGGYIWRFPSAFVETASIEGIVTTFLAKHMDESSPYLHKGDETATLHWDFLNPNEKRDMTEPAREMTEVLSTVRITDFTAPTFEDGTGPFYSPAMVRRIAEPLSLIPSGKLPSTARDLLNELDFTRLDLMKLSDRILDDIDAGLENGPSASSLAMARAYFNRPTGREKGFFLTLDWGGTNWRVDVWKLDGKGQLAVVDSSKERFSDAQKQNPIEIFDFLAGVVESLKKKNAKAKDFSFVFAFNLDLTDDGQALLVNWAKEGWSDPDSGEKVEGRDIAALFQTAFEKRGLKDLHLHLPANDTFDPLLVFSYVLAQFEQSAEHVRISFIDGTGFNVAADLGPRFGFRNFEMGRFGKLEGILTETDQELDRESQRPGKNVFEKLISGDYLGEQLRRRIVKISETSDLFSWVEESRFSQKGAVETDFLTLVLSDSIREGGVTLPQTQLTLEREGVETTEIERLLLYVFSAALELRAGSLVGVSLSSVIRALEPNAVRSHYIPGEGSLVAILPGRIDSIKRGITAVLGETRAARVHIILNQLNEEFVQRPNGNGSNALSGAGSAVAAAVNGRNKTDTGIIFYAVAAAALTLIGIQKDWPVMVAVSLIYLFTLFLQLVVVVYSIVKPGKTALPALANGDIPFEDAPYLSAIASYAPESGLLLPIDSFKLFPFWFQRWVLWHEKVHSYAFWAPEFMVILSEPVTLLLTVLGLLPSFSKPDDGKREGGNDDRDNDPDEDLPKTPKPGKELKLPELVARGRLAKTIAGLEKMSSTSRKKETVADIAAFLIEQGYHAEPLFADGIGRYVEETLNLKKEQRFVAWGVLAESAALEETNPESALALSFESVSVDETPVTESGLQILYLGDETVEGEDDQIFLSALRKANENPDQRSLVIVDKSEDGTLRERLPLFVLEEIRKGNKSAPMIIIREKDLSPAPESLHLLFQTLRYKHGFFPASMEELVESEFKSGRLVVFTRTPGSFLQVNEWTREVLRLITQVGDSLYFFGPGSLDRILESAQQAAKHA